MKRFHLILAALMLVPAMYAGDTLHLAFVGDIMMGTTYPTNRLPANDGKNLFDDAAPLLRAADVAFGNMEGAMLDGGTCAKGSGPNVYAFRMPTSYAPLLKDAGLDFMCVSNNHIRDFGTDGIQSTLRCLDGQGIRYAGLPKLCESTIIVQDSVRYGVLAFGQNSYCLMHTDTAKVARLVKQMRPKCDILVVVFHGGAEGSSYRHVPEGKEICFGENRGELRKFSHLCIDLGADIVCGHGPHVVRGMELYKGHLIAYSLGNFCTPYGMNLSGVSGYAPVLTVNLDKKGMFLNGQIHSMIQKPGVGPRKDSTHSAAKDIRLLSKEDFPSSKLVISETGQITLP